MAELRCGACGSDTFEALSEPGFFRCHNCGAGSTVRLVPGAMGAGVRLMGPGPRKIEVIKVVRSHTGLGLKEAKDLVDASERSPQMLSLPPGSASTVDRYASDLEQAGAAIQRG
jgi:hypothetical protein